MGQVRHGSATTTYAVRAAIQRSQASLATLSRQLGINPKTVAKWRKRTTVEDLKTGPKAPHSTTLAGAAHSSASSIATVILMILSPDQIIMTENRYQIKISDSHQRLDISLRVR